MSFSQFLIVFSLFSLVFAGVWSWWSGEKAMERASTLRDADVAASKGFTGVLFLFIATTVAISWFVTTLGGN